MGRQGAKVIGFAVVIVLMLVGCGDSSDTSDTTSVSISKAAFVKQANKICDRTKKSYVTAAFVALSKAEKENPEASLSQLEDEVVAERYVPTFRQEVEELEALGTPDEGEGKLEAFFREINKLLDRVEENPKDYALAQAQFQHPYREAAKLAKAYGIQVCGEP